MLIKPLIQLILSAVTMITAVMVPVVLMSQSPSLLVIGLSVGGAMLGGAFGCYCVIKAAQSTQRAFNAALDHTFG